MLRVIMLNRLLLVLALLFSPVTLPAAVWQSPEFGVGVALPDGADWVPLPEAVTPTLRVLAGVVNQKTNSMFNLAVQTALAGKSIDDPNVAEAVKKDLTAAGYQIFGYSKIGAGTAQWIQFPVNGNGAKGVVRVTGANGQIFTVTMLRGDGKNALEDPELMRAGASFRVSAVTAPTAPPATPAEKSEQKVAQPKSGEVESPATIATPVAEGEMDYKRIAIGGGILVFLLLMAWGIVGSGKK